MKRLLLTPAAWCEVLDIEVLDDDGWRDGKSDWYAPIEFDDFINRLSTSTISLSGIKLLSKLASHDVSRK